MTCNTIWYICHNRLWAVQAHLQFNQLSCAHWCCTTIDIFNKRTMSTLCELNALLLIDFCIHIIYQIERAAVIWKIKNEMVSLACLYFCEIVKIKRCINKFVVSTCKMLNFSYFGIMRINISEGITYNCYPRKSWKKAYIEYNSPLQ